MWRNEESAKVLDKESGEALMLHYIYDGSFSGFLTLVHHVLSEKKVPDRISSSDSYQPGSESCQSENNKYQSFSDGYQSGSKCYQPDLFSQEVMIAADRDKADRVIEAIREKISRKCYQTVYRCFLSEIDGFERATVKFICRGFQSGEGAYRDWTDPDTALVRRAEKRVNRELHRYQGLLRFRMLESEILYAPYRPEHNISGLLARHFSKRLAAERWIIHDKGRNTAVIYADREWLEIPAEMLEKLKFAGDEEEYQRLWIRFFESISIKERKNLKTQASFMPKKCREFLIEK